MTPMLGIMASSITGGLSTNSFQSITTTTVGSGGAADVTFSSIAATYTHLQIRVSAGLVAGGQLCRIQLNSDTTTTNYYTHALEGDGATAYAYSGNIFPYVFAASNATSVQASAIIDILDYANTNKYKTIRSLGAKDINGGGEIALFSGLWKNTNATTTIRIFPNSSSFSEYSKFALYGIKGA